MPPDTDRILTTHSGSLPRPAELHALLLAQEQRKPVDEAKLTGAVRRAVAQAADLQANAGVDLLGDGEMSKPGYSTYVKDRLTGFGGESDPMRLGALVAGPDLTKYPDFFEAFSAARVSSAGARRHTACDGPVSYVGQDAVLADIENLKAAVAGTDPAGVFMTAASPGVISVFSPNLYYPGEEEYLAALAEAMREEYEAIHDAGFILQLDCPDLAMIAPAFGSLQDFRAQMALEVDVLNHALANIPAEATRIHVCWGNGNMPRTSDVALKDIVDIILTAKPAGLMLMGSNGRHAHEWRVFEDVRLPEGKYVIPGVIDPTTNVVEHPEVVADRLIRYASVVGRENVIAGTDCGFSTLAVGGSRGLAPSIVWAKLRSQAEGARIASEHLWSAAA
jgi:5-methyltetrahydropteroyltriglutamate--homocysteine methyltransferase